MPAQLRGDVLAAHAEAVVYLVIAHLLVLGNVVALDGEGWHLRHEVVGQRSPVGHGSSYRESHFSHVPVWLPTLLPRPSWPPTEPRVRYVFDARQAWSRMYRISGGMCSARNGKGGAGT